MAANSNDRHPHSRHAADRDSLRRLKALAWMSPEAVERLAASGELLRVRRHRLIFPEGVASNHVYIMMSGVAKLSILNRAERGLVGLVGPGEIFGVSSLLPSATRPFRCEAFTDCTVAALKPEEFVETTLGIPLETLSRVLDVTVGRWWTMLLRYANFVGSDLRDRLAGGLLELAAKFGVRDSRGMLLTLKLTHEDLADLVGASRQRITVQLKEFERERSLIRDGRRIIVVPEKLLKGGEPSERVHRSSGHAREQAHHRKRASASLPGSRH